MNYMKFIIHLQKKNLQQIILFINKTIKLKNFILLNKDNSKFFLQKIIIFLDLLKLIN